MKKKRTAGKPVVRRIRDELSRKAAKEGVWSVSNQHQVVQGRTQLFQAHLEMSLKKHFKPSLLRLDAAPVEKDIIYESIRVDASLQLSKQLYMLEFAFRRFAFRWRKIKLHSGIHLWATNIQLLKKHICHQRILARHATKIQRCFRAKRNRDVEASQRVSLAAQLEAIIQEQARLKQKHFQEVRAAIRIQCHCRGFLARVMWHSLLRHRLFNALSTLSIHQLFGSLEEVQVAGGHFYATTDEDIQVIHDAHHWLHTHVPPFMTAQRLNCIEQVEAIGNRRVSQGVVRRTKQRHTYWSMLENHLAEISLKEARNMRIAERKMERLRIRQARHHRHADELRGVRNLLSWQEERQRQEQSERELMGEEEVWTRQYDVNYARYESRLKSEAVKRSIALLRSSVKQQLGELEMAREEIRRMRHEEEIQRLALCVERATKCWIYHIGVWRTIVVAYLAHTKAMPIAAIDVIFCMSSSASSSSIVHRVTNATELRQGLWERFSQDYATPLCFRRQRHVHHQVRLVGSAVECMTIRVESSMVNVDLTRCNGELVSNFKLSSPLLAVLSMLERSRVAWLRPKNISKLMEWIVSCVKWISPQRGLVFIPPIELASHSYPSSSIPMLQAVVQKGVDDLQRFTMSQVVK
ncbi:hypothetical protein AeRB84_009970 [Aphanomyces euteiches]|nr:hypothetical protein AeRB84_009970 [Aphanomyces euteiches]